MMKTITKQPILFTDVPVADLRNSMKHDLNQNLIERLWNKIRDFFLGSDKQKAFKSIHKYINTLSPSLSYQPDRLSGVLLACAMGYLILRGASRLDAFSVYPFQTWLLGHALGNATDTPEVRPTRSSRTKVSSSQISYAYAG